MKHILDEKSMLDGAKEAGRTEGFEKGKLEVALTMIKRGMSSELIADLTGFPIEQILEIQKQILS